MTEQEKSRTNRHGKAVIAASLGGAILLVGIVWLFNPKDIPEPPPPEEMKARCNRVFQDFLQSKPTLAMIEYKITKEDLDDAKRIWLDQTVPDDAFATKISDAISLRHENDIKNDETPYSASVNRFAFRRIRVDLPSSAVKAYMECELRSYGEVWKLYHLRLGREGTDSFSGFVLTKPTDFPGR